MFGIKRLKAHIAYLKQNRVADREVIKALENRLLNVLAKLNESNTVNRSVTIAGGALKWVTCGGSITFVDESESSPYANTSIHDLQIKLKYCVDCEDYETAKEIQEVINNRLIS